MTFWVLLVVGWKQLGPARSAIVIAVWLAGYVGLRYVPQGDLFVTPYVAILDIVLVFVIFKGDVRLR